MARSPRPPARPGGTDLRARVAAEAAKLLAEHGSGDPVAARRKAATRLGARHEHDLPGEAEILAALREHQRLFGMARHARGLQAQREAALEAMEFLQHFDPRLCGPVLEGTADGRATVTLHLHADDSAEVLRWLDSHRIPHDESGCRVALADGTEVDAAVLGLSADGVPFELVVLPRTALRQPPVSRLDRVVQRRAGRAELRRLVAAEN
jgi:hypothetical protein